MKTAAVDIFLDIAVFVRHYPRLPIGALVCIRSAYTPFDLFALICHYDFIADKFAKVTLVHFFLWLGMEVCVDRSAICWLVERVDRRQFM